LEVVDTANDPLNLFPGSSMSPATVWIIFTRVLNVILAS